MLKEKCLQNTKGQESKDIFWIMAALYGPIPKEMSQKLMDCTRPLSHFCLEDHLQAAVMVAREKTSKCHRLVCAFGNNSQKNHLIRNAGLHVSCHIYSIAVCRVAVLWLISIPECKAFSYEFQKQLLKSWALAKVFWLAQWCWVWFPCCKMSTQICALQINFYMNWGTVTVFIFGLVSDCKLPTVMMSIDKWDTPRPWKCQKYDVSNITGFSFWLTLVPSSAFALLKKHTDGGGIWDLPWKIG